MFTRHQTGTLEFVVCAGYDRPHPRIIFIKDPGGGLPTMEEDCPLPGRSDKSGTEFYDPDAPMDFIFGEYPNPDRFDKSEGWKPTYTHFLRHTLLFPTACPANWVNTELLACPPGPRSKCFYTFDDLMPRN